LGGKRNGSFQHLNRGKQTSAPEQAGLMKILHLFFGTNDSAYPIGNLIDVGGTFYGTTFRDGAYGNGTIFEVTP